VAVAQLLSSPLLNGPPLCDELIAFVQHVFTEEEASVVQYLNGVKPKTAAAVAKAAKRPVEEVEPILYHLGYKKFVIGAEKRGTARLYKVIPIAIGIFEFALIGQDPETMSDWHRRLAELFEALFETGYMRGVGSASVPLIRFMPVNQVATAHPAALPSDKFEVVLDRFKTFGVGNCQCRMARKIVGKGCDKPIGNCLGMGEHAESFIRRGQLREVSKKEALEIKLQAESNGLVTWILNVDTGKSQAACSCCGCCCAAMRTVNEFSAPAMFAPPHFLPAIDRAKCNYCGNCAKTCPMGSLVVDTKQKDAWQALERCIGCGLCSLACDKKKAIVMNPVPDYRLPPESWFGFIAQSGGQAAQKMVHTYLSRSPLATWWPG
jgi:Pyruvate/2-oxoacid:ferredoxin oxidoreductase delta subunit